MTCRNCLIECAAVMAALILQNMLAIGRPMGPFRKRKCFQ